MRSRILSLWLPDLPTDRLRRRARRESEGTAALSLDQPLATFASERGALQLAALCPRARAAGLTPGMMLTEARARLPELQVRPAAPEADRELLERLATWCERYTPYVTLDRSCPHDMGGALWLDLTGCAHLFGGEAALQADLEMRLGRQGFAVRSAIADTPGAAWAVARFGQTDRRIVPPGEARTALAPLPVAALRIEPEMVRMLERLGLTRIDSLYPLPRQALAARFGEALITRLDQALGRLAEPIAARDPRPAHRAERSLAEPLLDGPALAALSQGLLEELCAGLTAAGLGVRRLLLSLHRVDGSTAQITIGTSRPCRDPGQLRRLLDEKLARVDPGFGIERVLLDALEVEPLLPEPIAWRAMGAGDLDQVRDLAPLVDRLSGRLGPEAVARPAPRASHIPERAECRVPPLDEKGQAPFPAPRHHDDVPLRPLRLLAPPEPIEAMAALPDAPPLLFRWRRVLHKVVRARGPERIAPEWWHLPDADPAVLTRDYFAVEDHEGGRFWLFREGLYQIGTPVLPRWYLHGLFG